MATYVYGTGNLWLCGYGRKDLLQTGYGTVDWPGGRCVLWLQPFLAERMGCRIGMAVRIYARKRFFKIYGSKDLRQKAIFFKSMAVRNYARKWKIMAIGSMAVRIYARTCFLENYGDSGKLWQLDLWQ